MPNLTASNALPAWKRNLPMLVLSILIVLCGLCMIPGLVDLSSYLPATSPPVTGPGRLLIMGMLAWTMPLGIIGIHWSITGRMYWILFPLTVFSNAALCWTLWYSIYAHPLATWNQ